jgi:glycerol-3-phosphate acyltransferase PlsY
MFYSLMALVAACLLGSIPFPAIVSRFVSGVDLRECGSGNMGAISAMNWHRARSWWEERRR